MRISVVHSFYTSELPSGENTVVMMQVEALRSAGHDVQLVDVYTDDLAKEKFFKLRSALNVVSGNGIDPTSKIKEFNPDVIHIHNLFPNLSTKWLKDWIGPIVTTVHNFRPVCASGILYRNNSLCTLCPDGSQWNGVINGCYRGSKIATIPLAIRNRSGVTNDPVLHRSDHVVYLSERSKDTYRQFGYEAKSSSVIANFVDNSLENENVESHSGAWIYVGRLAPEKGVVEFLRNWPSTEIIDVIGEGPDYNLVASEASPNVRVHGLKPRSDVLSAIAKAKGLAIPSTCAENFPTVYAEALAAGVPVVGKTGNAASDDIVLARTGKVFAEWNEVPSAIHYVNQFRNELSVIARNRFDQKFAKDNWLLEIMKVYRQVVQQKIEIGK